MGERRFFPGFNPSRYLVSPRDLEQSKKARSIHDVLQKASGMERITTSDMESRVAHIRQLFKFGLHDLSRTIGEPFPLTGRHLKFVDQTKLMPKTHTDKEYWLKSYGDTGEKNIGDCNLLPNGTFILRVAMAKQNKPFPNSTILETLIHEYGHTLSNFLSSAFYEELKANAFKSLYLNNFGIHIQNDGPVGTVQHDVINYLLKLHRVGVSDERILAHLTKQRFGSSGPQDYKKI